MRGRGNGGALDKVQSGADSVREREREEKKRKSHKGSGTFFSVRLAPVCMRGFREGSGESAVAAWPL
jgi:hypothetical protein